MQIQNMLDSMKNCPCGREHTVQIKAVEVGRGLKNKVADILSQNGFPKNILVVADQNTLGAAEGILNVLTSGGFTVKTQIYDNLRTADQCEVERIEALSDSVDGVLSVGTGSLNDICRRACLLRDKEFAIFATAPSMDGFASDTAPITNNNFKVSQPARQPSIIIGDTEILAAAPIELKAAGYGDMIAKFVAMADWRIAELTIGEYYCENVANVTRTALRKLVALTDKVTANDPETAGAIMEALVLTGIAMKLCYSSRAASGAEHVVSHFWECKKLEQGHLSDYHGKKVGVATLMITRMYYDIIENADPAKFTADTTDWNKVYAVYGKNFEEDVRKLNTPTVTAETTPQILKDNWNKICDIVREEMPTPAEIENLLNRAGAAVTLEDIAVSKELGLLGLEYHPYMRHRLLLSRLLPMLDYKVNFSAVAEI